MTTDTRDEFLYDRFGCSQEHLKVAFRCVVQQGPLDPKAADRLADVRDRIEIVQFVGGG